MRLTVLRDAELCPQDGRLLGESLARSVSQPLEVGVSGAVGKTAGNVLCVDVAAHNVGVDFIRWVVFAGMSEGWADNTGRGQKASDERVE